MMNNLINITAHNTLPRVMLRKPSAYKSYARRRKLVLFIGTCIVIKVKGYGKYYFANIRKKNGNTVKTFK